MKIHALLALAGMFTAPLHGQTLSSADREALLERIEKLRESVDARLNERYRVAIAAYREGSASDDAARDFYITCLEKVNFTDQHKKNSEFREWKRKNAEKLTTPGLGLALRLQLAWLMLSLRASVDEPDRQALATSAQEIIDTIAREAQKLKGHETLLSQAVTSTVFARAYDIGRLKMEEWPLAPLPIEAVYEQVLLPPLRNPRSLEQLRAAWTRRIQQEMAIQETKTSNGQEGEQKRIGTVAALRPPEYELFLAETLPTLQWRMEVDLFKAGDEQSAAIRMLSHIEKYMGHKSSREWSEQFKALLLPKEEAPPKTETGQP